MSFSRPLKSSMLIVAPMSLLLLLQLGCPPSGPASKPGAGSQKLDRGGLAGRWDGKSNENGEIYVAMTFQLAEENRFTEIVEFAEFSHDSGMSAVQVRDRMMQAWNSNPQNTYTKVLDYSIAGFLISPNSTHIKNEVLNVINEENVPSVVPPGGSVVVKPPPPAGGLKIHRAG